MLGKGARRVKGEGEEGGSGRREERGGRGNWVESDGV